MMKRFFNIGTRELLVSVVILGVVAVGIYQQHQYVNTAAQESPEVVKLDVDHKRYSDIGSLRHDADIVIRGTVLTSGETTQGTPTVAADGRSIPAIPQTNFTINVERALKGKDVAKQITINLTGGTVNGLNYQVDDIPWLSKGQRAIFFLKDGGDGKYYPLAGGSGIAKQGKKSNSYDLPEAASDRSIVDIAESALTDQ
jgi:hypothetical protein